MFNSNRAYLGIAGAGAFISIVYWIWKYFVKMKSRPSILDIAVIDLNTLENKNENPEAYEKECAKVC